MGWGIGALIIGAVVWGLLGCWFDFAYRRLPNLWLGCGAALLIIGAAVRVFTVPVQATGPVSTEKGFTTASATALSIGLGATLWFSIYFVPFVVAARAIGAGDVKLAALLGGGIGLIVGAPLATAMWTCGAVVLAAVFTLMLAAVETVRVGTGSRRQARVGASRRTAIAHGPAMIAAVAVVWTVNGGWL